MKLDSLNLTNFRNYELLNISFQNFNIIYGMNGSGKTNIVEAIYLLSLSKSFRSNNDKIMIKKGKVKTLVQGCIISRGLSDNFCVEITENGKNVFVNGDKLEKVSDYISRINVVLFNPSDTRLVDDAPDKRRKMLNVEISQLYKQYLIVLGNYQKILKQRNFYLKNILNNEKCNSAYLDILTEKLVEYGSIVCKYRLDFINKINEYIGKIYESISGGNRLKIRYVSTFKNKSREELILKFKSNYEKEYLLGKTIDGPHHDDIVFLLDGNNLKEWGSEGQRKNAIISFKLAQISVIYDIKGVYPILILDDLFSELDKEKINNLVRILNKEVQTFVTTTDIKNVSKQLVKEAKIIKVDNGILEEEIK